MLFKYLHDTASRKWHESPLFLLVTIVPLDPMPEHKKLGVRKGYGSDQTNIFSDTSSAGRFGEPSLPGSQVSWRALADSRKVIGHLA